ncbi:CDP-glycerol glycerophosphotransferase family protein [Microlunatus elymi]|uniref:CDP-glycerol glycerophosphotransferase family protein n=1 Tax=Microlunatus elymi TaxID=2596828 RepID=A0A516Q0F3_9ACTN|nr:CDP-glycerol glycerophosphotransferase family protein [Microlunatus elymi]QDP96888.1 CDP-glycerol glycerophosphotransferase family protein [Microlunatus elymi]
MTKIELGSPLKRLVGRVRQLSGSSASAPNPKQQDAQQPVESEQPPNALTSRLLRVCWAEPDYAGVRRLVLEGAAWRRGDTLNGTRVIGVRLVRGDNSYELPVEPLCSAAFNDFSKSPMQDRTHSGFRAVIDLIQLVPAELRDDASSVFEHTWQVQLVVRDEAGDVTDRLRDRDDGGSAGQLNAGFLGRGLLARPTWSKGRGLSIVVSRRAFSLRDVALEADQFVATVERRGDFAATTALLRRENTDIPLRLREADAGAVEISGSYAEALDLDPTSLRAQSWYLLVADADGATRHVHWQGDARHGFRQQSATDPRAAVRFGPNGVVRLDVHPYRLVVDRIDLTPGRSDDCGDSGRLRISGTCHAVCADPADWRLVAGRRTVEASGLEIGDGRFAIEFAQTAIHDWGLTPVPLALGDYELTTSVDRADRGPTAEAEVKATLDAELAETLPRTVRTAGNTFEIRRGRADALTIRIGPPLAAGERSKYTVRRLENRHVSGPVAPTDTVLLNSYFGKSVSDNSLAIADVIADRRPDLRLLWTVADYSVEVPGGTTGLVYKSAEWWRALTSSRYIIDNCWLPGRFRRRDHQRVLQAWHGTPLKLLGNDRIGIRRGDEYRRKTAEEVGQWDFLIAQNEYSKKIFESAYGYRGNILQIGYPRNDVLVRADDAYRHSVRQRLGIEGADRVVLYAPTWREQAKGLFRELDFDAVTSFLGPTGRLLVRGHPNVVKYGRGVAGERLLDVTLYPQLSDLYLASDVMITDYSSTMFDFSVTGKPIIFFVPDLEEYSDVRRGTYFDLAASAPGPVLRTTDETIDALRDLDEVAKAHADNYRAWQQKFNPLDDGRAAERAVDALLAG